MARVMVFVDDAVSGRLPDVCALDGVPATGRTRFSTQVGGGAQLGVLWLLLLAGPIGWLALFLIAVSRSGRGEVLRVAVPMSDAAHDRHRTAVRARRGAFTGVAAVLAVLVVALVAPAGPLSAHVSVLAVLVLGAIAFGVAAVWGEYRLGRTSIDIDLDASRRWVTLSGVHPDFATACEQHQQLHGRR